MMRWMGGTAMVNALFQARHARLDPATASSSSLNGAVALHLSANVRFRPIADISKALSLSAMRISGLLFLPCYAVLLGCEQPSEHPEVAYRYCMAELARESARTGEVTFEEATAFSHECQRFAVEAATLRSRDELGAKFDAQSSETASHIRDNLQMIVRAHVCAFASERDLQRCTPIM